MHTTSLPPLTRQEADIHEDGGNEVKGGGQEEHERLGQLAVLQTTAACCTAALAQQRLPGGACCRGGGGLGGALPLPRLQPKGERQAEAHAHKHDCSSEREGAAALHNDLQGSGSLYPSHVAAGKAAAAPTCRHGPGLFKVLHAAIAALAFQLIHCKQAGARGGAGSSAR